MKPRRNIFLTSFLALALTQASHAASGTWTGSTDGNWHTAGNWTGGVPNAAADIATFNAASSNTTVSIAATGTTVDRINFSGASTAAYTLTGTAASFTNMTMSTNGGGVFIDSAVTTNQDLSGIPIIRPGMADTINFSNQGSGWLKLGTFQAQNSGDGNLSTMVFAPGANGSIEIVTGKKIDNAGTGGVKKIAIVLDDVGTLRIAAIGSYDGSNTDGNSVSIRQGTLEAAVIKNSGTQSSLGAGGRIQFGSAATTNTATLDYYGATDTTNRDFQIVDNNTAVFKVSGSADTNLTITSSITQSGAASGGGKLTKDGAGILTLSGANTFTGDTSINNGKIALGNALALQHSAYDTTGSTGAIGLDVTGFTTPTFGGLKGSVDLATAITGYGSVTSLTLNPQSGKSATYSGIISDGNGSISLIKSGAGTQVLSGNNSFTGTTNVIGGTLTVATNGVINNANTVDGTGSISAGATLRIDGGTAKFNTSENTLVGLQVGTTTAGNVVVTNNGTLNVNTGRLILGGSSAGSGTSTFTQDSGTTTVASNLNTGNFNDTNVDISGGSFTVSGSAILSQRGNTNFNISGTADVNFQAALNLGGVVDTSYNAILNLDGGSLSVVNIANSANGNTTFNFNGGTLKANAASADFLNADSVYVKVGGATIDTNGFDVTIDNALLQSGATTGALTKTGAGTLTLSAENTYTGATTVSVGTLIIDGNISTSSLTTVEENGTIGGSGTVGALTIDTGGFINPGNSTGGLTVEGNYIQAGLYTAEINGLTAETQHDQIDVTGTVNITGGSLATLFTGSYSANDLIFILLNDGTDAITGTFTGLAQGATVTSYGGFDWQISYIANSDTSSFTGGNDIALIAIPEPGAALLGGLGMLALLRRRRA